MHDKPRQQRYSLWKPPGEGTLFCSSGRLCWNQIVSKEWTYKYSLSLAAGPPGDTSGLMPESWDLGSRIKTQHIFWSVIYAWDLKKEKKIYVWI